jgi:predicted porin
MRRALLLVLLWRAQAAQGADGVTVFGVLDTFATQIHADGAGSVTRLDASGLLASRIGVRGHEDLCDGYRASFTLEAGLDGDKGAQPDSNRLFNRQAWLGLSGAPGELRIGRQNTPHFYMNGKFDAFTSATQASGWNNLFGPAPRADSSISYITPRLGGWVLQAMLARGATGGGTPLPSVADNQNTHWTAEYDAPGVYFGANYQTVKRTGLPYMARRIAMGASWTVTPAWTVYGVAGRQTRSDDSQRDWEYSLSVRYRCAGLCSFSLGWTALHDQLQGAGHGDAHQWGAMAQQRLSTRTTLYAALARLSQQGQRNSFALLGAGVVAPDAQIRSPLPGGDLRGVQLGILHLF